MVYRSIIGSLPYLCASRPDIMLRVRMCARFQVTPKESHHLVLKQILHYLAYTPMLGLWYHKGSSFDLARFYDSDYTGDHVGRKSTSGTYHFLRGSLVCWSSRKQTSVAVTPCILALSFSFGFLWIFALICFLVALWSSNLGRPSLIPLPSGLSS